MSYSICVSRTLIIRSALTSRSLWRKSSVSYCLLRPHPPFSSSFFTSSVTVPLSYAEKTRQVYFHTHSTTERRSTTDATTAAAGEFKLVYTGPFKGAVRALKVFSLTTAVLASVGGPVLVWLGDESVPLAGRVALSSLVMLVSISTTAILHWLLKGYIIHLYYNPQAQRVATYTLSLLARKTRNEFDISDIRPPAGLAGFSTFQALGKSYFMHTEIFPDNQMLSQMLDTQSREPQKTDV